MSQRRHRLQLLLSLTLALGLAGCQSRSGDSATAPELSRTYLSPIEAAQLREDAIEFLLQHSVSEQAEVRANALEALQRVPTRSRAALRVGLRDANLGVRYVAAFSIGKLQLEDLGPEVRRLINDPDPSVQAAALFALHQCGESVDISPLSTMLLQSDPTLRGNVAFILGEMGNPSAVPLLREAARTPMPRVGDAHLKRVQLQIAESLARLGDEEALQAIRAALYAPPEQGEAQALAAAMIGRLGDERSVDTLILLTARTEAYLSAEVRLACAASLAQLGRTQGAFIADRYFRNQQPALRAQSAFVYGQIGDAANLGLLRDMMLSDPSLPAQIHAASAILQVTSN
jgi:HEAT repeat protein